MNMVEKKVDANSVEEVVFVNMVEKKVDANSVEEVVFVNMVEKNVNANSVLYVRMEKRHMNAQSANPKNVFLVLLVKSVQNIKF